MINVNDPLRLTCIHVYIVIRGGYPGLKINERQCDKDNIFTSMLMQLHPFSDSDEVINMYGVFLGKQSSKIIRYH